MVIFFERAKQKQRIRHCSILSISCWCIALALTLDVLSACTTSIWLHAVSIPVDKFEPSKTIRCRGLPYAIHPHKYHIYVYLLQNRISSVCVCVWEIKGKDSSHTTLTHINMWTSSIVSFLHGAAQSQCFVDIFANNNVVLTHSNNINNSEEEKKHWMPPSRCVCDTNHIHTVQWKCTEKKKRFTKCVIIVDDVLRPMRFYQLFLLWFIFNRFCYW